MIAPVMIRPGAAGCRRSNARGNTFILAFGLPAAANAHEERRYGGYERRNDDQGEIAPFFFFPSLNGSSLGILFPPFILDTSCNQAGFWEPFRWN